jgi:hypothetical protein
MGLGGGSWIFLMGPLIGAAAGLVGVVLGFVLVTRQRRKEDETRKDAIRRMLQTEIDHNIKELEEWCTAPVFENFPGPSAQIWDTQLPAIPTVLEFARLEKVHAFYYQLRSLSKYLAEGAEKVEKDLVQRETHPGQMNTFRQIGRDIFVEDKLEPRVRKFLEDYKSISGITNND